MLAHCALLKISKGNTTMKECVLLVLEQLIYKVHTWPWPVREASAFSFVKEKKIKIMRWERGIPEINHFKTHGDLHWKLVATVTGNREPVPVVCRLLDAYFNLELPVELPFVD